MWLMFWAHLDFRNFPSFVHNHKVNKDRPTSELVAQILVHTNYVVLAPELISSR